MALIHSSCSVQCESHVQRSHLAYSTLSQLWLLLQSRHQASVHHTKEANPTFPGVPGALRVKTVPGLEPVSTTLAIVSGENKAGNLDAGFREQSRKPVTLWFHDLKTRKDKHSIKRKKNHTHTHRSLRKEAVVLHPGNPP